MQRTLIVASLMAALSTPAMAQMDQLDEVAEIQRDLLDTSESDFIDALNLGDAQLSRIAQIHTEYALPIAEQTQRLRHLTNDLIDLSEQGSAAFRQASKQHAQAMLALTALEEAKDAAIYQQLTSVQQTQIGRWL